VLRHARALYEGARLDVHHVAKVKCVGSRSVKMFDPRPGEQQRFKVPDPGRRELKKFSVSEAELPLSCPNRLGFICCKGGI